MVKGEALNEWRRITAELEPSKTLTSADRAALTRYVQAWAIAEEAARQIEETGTVITLPNGYPGPTPYLKVHERYTALCLRCLAEFGGTPNARARLPGAAAAGQKPANDALPDF